MEQEWFSRSLTEIMSGNAALLKQLMLCSLLADDKVYLSTGKFPIWRISDVVNVIICEISVTQNHVKLVLSISITLPGVLRGCHFFSDRTLWVFFSNRETAVLELCAKSHGRNSLNKA